VKSWLVFAGLMMALCLPARAKQVVVSVEPLRLIIAPLLNDVADVDVLIRPGQSPHHYALKPSDIVKMSQARLTLWFGPSLEPFLTKAIARLPSEQVIQLDKLDLAWRSLSEPEHDHSQAHEKDHEHHDHESSDIDPHFWLSPSFVRQVLGPVVKELSLHFPAQVEQIISNHQRFDTQLIEIEKAVSASLKGGRSQAFVTYHRSLEYFVAEFALNQQGIIAANLERNLSGKTLLDLRRQIQQNNVVCILSEPEFSQVNLTKVTQGMAVKQVEVDLLGAKLSSDNAQYQALMRRLAEDVRRCLSLDTP
jgi:zinc transport system substrate-binding protein